MQGVNSNKKTVSVHVVKVRLNTGITGCVCIGCWSSNYLNQFFSAISFPLKLHRVQHFYIRCWNCLFILMQVWPSVPAELCRRPAQFMKQGCCRMAGTPVSSVFYKIVPLSSTLRQMRHLRIVAYVWFEKMPQWAAAALSPQATVAASTTFIWPDRRSQFQNLRFYLV